jgi:hypothetical protein
MWNDTSLFVQQVEEQQFSKASIDVLEIYIYI